MHDSAILNHAARIVGAVGPSLPADAALRRYFIEFKHLGPSKKRQVSHAVFAYYRWVQWLDRRASQQVQVDQAMQLHERFAGNPKSLKTEALAALAVPPWTKDEVVFPPESLQVLQRDPTLWIRARPGNLAKLSTDLGDCQPPSAAEIRGQDATQPDAPTCALTLPVLDALEFRGSQDLFLTPAFHQGAFEIQDLASQLVGLSCAARAGETWWDACAGEGGKTLHLADQMQNKGLIWATDRSARRLHTLRNRAKRAHIFNFRSELWDGGPKLPTKTKFDGILVDAPCSGLGTWQRNPHARWTATIEDVRELAQIQQRLLEHVCTALKPGGRLIYSVCTLTRSETTGVASAFQAAHPELEPIPVFGAAPQLLLWPHSVRANGMFIAAWRRRPNAS